MDTKEPWHNMTNELLYKQSTTWVKSGIPGHMIQVYG